MKKKVIVMLFIVMLMVGCANSNLLSSDNSSTSKVSDKEVIYVYDKELGKYGLKDIDGNLIEDYKYNNISRIGNGANNIYELKSDDQIKKVTIQNYDLSKYSSYETYFDCSNNTDDLVLLKNSKELLILTTKGRKVYQFDNNSCKSLNKYETSEGIWYKLTTEEEVIFFTQEKIIYKTKKDNFYKLFDNYISVVDEKDKTDKGDDVLTTYKYNKDGNLLKTINGSVDFENDYYLVVKTAPQKINYGYYNYYNVYNKNGELIIQNASTYLAENEILITEIPVGSETSKVEFYDDGMLFKTIESASIDEFAQIYNGTFLLTSYIDYKTNYYDIKGNKLSNVDVVSNDAVSINSYYINGYVLYTKNSQNEAEIINAQTGEVFMSDIYLSQYNEELLKITNGEYLIIIDKDRKTAIYDKDFNIVVDYQDGTYAYVTPINAYSEKNFNENRLCLIEDKKFSCYDVKNKFNKIFEVDGEYYFFNSGFNYFAIRTSLNRFKYYDFNGKLISE